MGRPSVFGPTRFVGALIPLELFEVFEAARAERGVADRSDALRQAIALWVASNPPSSGVPKVIGDALGVVNRHRAVREVLSQAIQEWRLGHSEDLLRSIRELSRCANVSVPPDVAEALEMLGDEPE